MKLKERFGLTRKQVKYILLILSFAFLLFLFPYPNIYFQTFGNDTPMGVRKTVILPDPPPYPVNVTGALPPVLSALAVYILDMDSGITLYEKNSKVRLPPASTTKITSALVGMDIFNMDDVLKVREVRNDGKTMGLVKNEELTFESLLYGALVHSGNDAAYVIAQNYSQGFGAFIEKMNEKAIKMGLSDTHFANPAGLDDPNQYTTARDLAIIAQTALKNKTISKIVSTRSITVSDVTYTIFHDLKNVNELLGKIPGVAGVKTGYTENGGEILITEMKKNNRSVLFIVLRSGDRFGETAKMISWVFDNFQWKDVQYVTPSPHSLNPV